MIPSVASEKIPSDITGDRSRVPLTSSIVPYTIKCIYSYGYVFIFYRPNFKVSSHTKPSESAILMTFLALLLSLSLLLHLG
jgi:hypothetical protein